MSSKLLVATRNKHKVEEYKEMLAELGDITWLSLWDVKLDALEVDETGATFEANARLKAIAYCNASGLITLADDSGLVVDALNGEPGVYSARYGAPDAVTDQARYRLLLHNLRGVSYHRRTARFKCVVAIATPDGDINTVAGSVEGHIADAPCGNNGFGYDPVFMLDNGQTMAQLPSHEKHRISHRGRALQAALPILRALQK